MNTFILSTDSKLLWEFLRVSTISFSYMKEWNNEYANSKYFSYTQDVLIDENQDYTALSLAGNDIKTGEVCESEVGLIKIYKKGKSIEEVRQRIVLDINFSLLFLTSILSKIKTFEDSTPRQLGFYDLKKLELSKEEEGESSIYLEYRTLLSV